MSTAKQAIGAWGEFMAEAHLLSKGYRILEHNHRTPYGEIDLVALQASGDSSSPQVVFVEVKTRTSMEFGAPEDAVDARKREHLALAAQHFMQSHPEFGEDWRVDVISVQKVKGTNNVKILHFEDVIHE